MDHGRILELDTPETLLNRHFQGAIIQIPWKEGFSLQDGEAVAEKLGAELDPQGMKIITSQMDRTIKSLLEANVNIDGLSVHKPNLEDLFIKLTGSSLRA
jgi:ABC-2 type transport system ATP-binding protein